MKKYIKSFRLRTLPLSISGIIVGTSLAAPNINGWVFLWAILTTVALQILTNLSNELGDALRGTDDYQEGRVAYGLQAGNITIAQVKQCIALFAFLSIVFGTILVKVALGTLFSWQALSFLLLGLFAIVAAIRYTLGRKPYGYHGWGDLSVFIFFGLLSTMGAYYLQTQIMTWQCVCAAVAIGLPIVAVLNLNNIRDMENDVKYGKFTWAAIIGEKAAKGYHTLILVCSFLFFLLAKIYLPLLLVPIFLFHIFFVWRNHGKILDKQFPLLVFSSLGLAILTGISMCCVN